MKRIILIVAGVFLFFPPAWLAGIAFFMLVLLTQFARGRISGERI